MLLLEYNEYIYMASGGRRFESRQSDMDICFLIFSAISAAESAIA